MQGRHRTWRSTHDQVSRLIGQGGAGHPPQADRPTPASSRARTSRSRSSSPSLCCASSFAPTTAARLRRAWGVVRPAAGPQAAQGAELLHAVVCRAEADEKGAFARLLSACFDRARRLGLIEPSGDRTVAIDSTGLETRHASMHFQRRVGLKKGLHAAWPKLTAVFDTATHLIGGVVTSRGASQVSTGDSLRRDSPQFAEAMRQAAGNLHPRRVLADKGYDAQHNHALCREELGIRSTVIPIKGASVGPPLAQDTISTADETSIPEASIPSTLTSREWLLSPPASSRLGLDSSTRAHPVPRTAPACAHPQPDAHRRMRTRISTEPCVFISSMSIGLPSPGLH